jgi:GPH family glycoside/pentoside/hexuronide:cation symporter
MQTDVIDADELETGRRREGSFSAIMGWVQKLGFALSVLLAGLILDFSGFDVALAGEQTEATLLKMRVLFVFFPIAMAGAMILLIRFYPLTEERCHEIRKELEARRGKLHDTAEDSD